MESQLSAGGGTGEAGRSLAVLYFQNLSGSKTDEYFRDGVTEDVIIELSRLSGLSVMSLSAVRALRDKSITAAEAGRDLGAAFVLEGSLRRAKNRLRLSVELVETRTGRTVWAERYEREIDDLFAIQTEIAQAITEKLKIVLSEEERRAIAKAPTTDVEAYDYCLRGRQHFRQFRRKSIEFAQRMFERAIEIDPNYAAAYAGLADCHSYLCMFWESSPESVAAADHASAKAVELDGDLAEAHVARGVAALLRKNYEEAEREFRIAIRLDPALFEAYYFFARGFYAQGKMDHAVYWFRRACEARPEDYQAPALLGSALRGLGLKRESDETHRRCVASARKHLEVTPGDTRALYFSAIALCQLGEHLDEALRLAERALAIDPDEPQVLYNVACAYALLGKADRAIDCLAKTIEHGELWRGWMENDPDLEALHGLPRFEALRKRPSGAA
jgi:TolB-like protein/Tfp pilus assembly protein PilF